jgi:hypothetical protein
MGVVGLEARDATRCTGELDTMGAVETVEEAGGTHGVELTAMRP